MSYEDKRTSPLIDDLKGAWERVKVDADRHRSFVSHPKLRSWLERDLHGWLADLTLACKLETHHILLFHVLCLSPVSYYDQERS